MSNRALKVVFVIFIILILKSNSVFSTLPHDSTNTLPIGNLLRYGFNKVMNVYNFNLLLDYHTDTQFGIFNIEQNYYGNASLEGRTIYQDDQTFKFNYLSPQTNNFRLLFNKSYLLTSNPGSVELNELSRLNGLLGIQYDISEINYINFAYGREQNSQVGVVSGGDIIQFEAKYLNNHSDLDIDGNLKGEMLKLNYDRSLNTINFNSNVSRMFSIYDYIRADFGVSYLDRSNLLRRDSVYMASNNLEFPFSVEERGSMTYFAELNLNFLISNYIFSGIKLSLNRNSVEKWYGTYVQNDLNTGVSKSRDITSFRLNADLNYVKPSFTNRLLLNYSTEDDQNTVSKLQNIDDNRFNQMKSEAFSLDNITSITNITNQTQFILTKSDTLKSNILLMLTRFDTPSETNYSDRDEFLTIISTQYSRKVNKLFSMGINAELQMNHLVYLKSQRSASNYWMRIIKLSPFFSYNSKLISLKPTFNILANYTVYDFESISPGVSSYSFRQIGYNDSITVRLTEKTSLLLNYDLIYRETGVLYWSSFQESPVSGNMKFFGKFFVKYRENEVYDVACGFRYYNLSNRNIAIRRSNPNDYVSVSLGPEINIKVNFSHYSLISFVGWYEFRYINDRFSGEIPNVYLVSQISL
ncbi:MAG: hypothetical protein KGZ71_05050 [Desulfobulbaceae bacterium]|nr:hypothetical protein [Candidatus Kapabacteria bacterium]MBS3999828.1 hypothetical protein [Desulfobulbaceae bacterium]